MKIIERGKPRQKTCPTCKCVFEYEVSDIEHIADQVLMMKDGQLIFQGKYDNQNDDLEEFYLSQFGEVDDNE